MRQSDSSPVDTMSLKIELERTLGSIFVFQYPTSDLAVSGETLPQKQTNFKISDANFCFYVSSMTDSEYKDSATNTIMNFCQRLRSAIESDLDVDHLIAFANELGREAKAQRDAGKKGLTASDLLFSF
jgi:hypothetical protein